MERGLASVVFRVDVRTQGNIVLGEFEVSGALPVERGSAVAVFRMNVRAQGHEILGDLDAI